MHINKPFALRIPYFVTLIGLFTPLIGSVVGYKFIEKYVAELILIILYSVLLIRDKNVLKFNYWQLVLYSTLLIVYIYGIFRDNSFGMYGLYSLFLMIFIFVNIFRRYANMFYLIKLYKEIKFVIFVNIIFIFFENMINIAGLEGFLKEITNQRYRLKKFI